MSDFTKIYTELAAIQTTLAPMKTAGDYKDILIEYDHRVVNNKRYPICFLLLDDGNLAFNNRGNMTLHVIGLFHKHTGSNLLSTILSAMEKTYTYLREGHPALGSQESGGVQTYINQNVLDPFLGFELPLTPPLGGFRMMYNNLRVNLQTNTT